MSYTKITPENADTLVVANSVMVHCSELLAENELNDIDFDFAIKVDRRDGDGVYLRVPGVTGFVPYISDTPRYTVDYLSNGYWWVKNVLTS